MGLAPMARQTARWFAWFLTGAGLGGAITLGGARDVALLAGIVVLIPAALVVLGARLEWDKRVLRSYRTSEPVTVGEDFSPMLALAVGGGLFGLGLVAAAVLPLTQLTLVAGLSGLIVLGLTWERGGD